MASETHRKRIAVITTSYTYLSHAQHITDRFLVGYPREVRWHRPEMDVVSLYVDQHPTGDQSQDRAREFGFEIYSTVTEALRCGGSKLAVDSVLIIGEHGDYPSNEKGQVLYPRYDWFKECVRVFEEDGRAVPVFNDKHLSYSFEKAKEMMDDAHRLGFPLLAGSSLPVTWRMPELELPLDCSIEGALMAGIGGSDSYDYHALEAMQCMVERRSGGETGVRTVQVIGGDDVWKAGDDGQWSWELLAAAIARSDTTRGMSELDGRTHDIVGTRQIKELTENPSAYLIEYNDGLQATMLLLNGAIRDFCFAAKLASDAEPVSTQFFLPPQPNVKYSACLVEKIEEMFMTGAAPYPAERTLLVSGMLEACLTSRLNGGELLETPYLDVEYRPPAESQYARAAESDRPLTG